MSQYLRFFKSGGVRLALLLVTAAATAWSVTAQPPTVKVKVDIAENKTEVVEPILPIDPQNRCDLSATGQMSYGLNVDGKRLTFSQGSARTMLRIDGQLHYPNTPVGQPLQPGPRGKPRHGSQSTFAHDNVHITHIMEVVPSRLPGPQQPGQKRKLDTVLVRYIVENKSDRPRTVGVRMRMDTYNVDNDGCLFGSPKKPNELVDGVVLQGKDLPEYLMSYQRAIPANPGNVAYFTLKLPGAEGPSRVSPTMHGAGENGWDVQVVRTGGGDTDIVLYWDAVQVPARGKRELAYAYGLGLATNPENEGRISLAFGGSFEPQKTFTVTAYVLDPLPNQTLTLELPAGLELREGQPTQPVPVPNGDNASLVLWKGSVQKLGAYDLKMRSSNGVTYSRKVSIDAAGQ